MPPVSPGHPHPDLRSITRRSFLIGASAAGLSLAAYAGTHARHEIEVTERTLALRNLPDAFVGFRFVQLSDIHLEEYTEPWFLRQAVQTINNLHPELVLLTGDFVSRGPATDRVAWRAAGVAAEVLSELRAPQRFACLGNHDVSVGAEHVINPLRAHGTPMLIDSYIPIQRGSDYIWLCGSDDAGTRTPDLNLSIPAYPTAPVILMCHEPDYVDHVIRHPRFRHIDAMLSGHTHGGQVRIPAIGPLILPPMGKKYIEGRFQFDHMELYVNRGLGTVGLPFRLNCPAEITHFTLQRA
ncbi:MAG TPA: metallophosphoesterase [Acidobacteriaceae bacterium]|nr:metallophosphoesterase [Acidobacteriaceae bacterium]